MAAHKVPKHLQKTKMIKIMVTPVEFEKFKASKNRLLDYSPTLRTYEILRNCVNQIDDLALIEFLKLDKNDSIRIKLQNDFLINRLGD